MDYKKLYEQSQEEISRLKANDEQSLQLTMQQNERFMDQLAEKDAEIENLKKEVVDERKKTANMEDRLKVGDIVREIERDYCNDNSPKRIYHSDDNDYPALHWIHHLRREITAAVEYHGLDESVIQEVIDAELPYADIETEKEMILQERDDYDEIDEALYSVADDTGNIILHDCPCSEALRYCVEKDRPLSEVAMLIREGGDFDAPIEEERHPFDDNMLNPLKW
jgi:hypothetical protein